MITRAHVYEEVVSPTDVEKLEEPKMGLLIYKAVYMCIRLLLDIRHNQVRISKGEKLELKTQNTSNVEFDTKEEKQEKPDNPVIKDSDVRFDNDKKE